MDIKHSNLFDIQLSSWMCGIYPWVQRDIHTTYWRLYCNMSEGGLLHIGEQTISMDTRNFYLVPSGLVFSTEAMTPLSQFFVHFNFSEDLGNAPDHLFTIPVDAVAEKYVQEYISLYRQSNCNTLRCTAIVTTLLGHVLLQCPQDEIFVTTPRDLRIQDCLTYINDNLQGQLDNSHLAKMSFMARNSFVRLFTEMTSESPQAYIRRKRIEQACQLLKNTDYSIKEVAEKVGFANQFHFSKVFTRLQLCSPRSYRQSLHCFTEVTKSTVRSANDIEDENLTPRLHIHPCKHISLTPELCGMPPNYAMPKIDDKLQSFTEKFEEYFLDNSTGLAYTSLNPATMRPGSPAFFRNFSLFSFLKRPEIPAHEFFKYLNSNMITADYLQFLVLGAHVHGKSREQLLRIRKTFHALYMIAEYGKELEYGFLPLLFGNKFSPETDVKQVLSIVSALDVASPLLTKQEQKLISELIAKVADFWMKRDYRYHFFNLHDDNWQWQLQYFPPLLALAFKHSGDIRFRQEYRRILSVLRTPYQIQFKHHETHDQQKNDFENRLGGLLVVEAANRFYADACIYDIIFRHSDDAPQERPFWHNALLDSWEDLRYSMTADGSYYSWQLFTPPEMTPCRIPCAANSYMFNAGSTSCRSTIISRGALQLSRHIPELLMPALTASKAVLENLEFETMFEFDQPERLQKTLLAHSQVLDGLSAVNWLWTALLLEETIKIEGKK